ncbi:Fe-S-containing hydro-lyase [Thermanaerosceptrum fracticalcis]|uniref:Fe-S-containing hydro-lyase n=1 Tax=Thermanaerosceptrum fracticalcis TaxID=1712410 RepID=A0A7G6E734_THEFR|nr:Fe-S-containing hydro-lyase [Thermanaerosceptrum fracticalcis]QNB47888.1 Fe-S-containing hydro-lyase [Thermanaerosceptrum fracticalcis]
MAQVKKITTPLKPEQIQDLKAGDRVTITGVIYTGRDAAHKYLAKTLQEGQLLPVDFTDQIIYYVGPCPAKPGQAIGSCGPTTSGRMDAYAPLLIEKGLKGMIGKGPRSPQVIDAMKKYGAVYFAAIGGAGATIARSVKKADVVAYPELGPEAIYRLEVEDFPCIVVIDAQGNDQYKIGVEAYRLAD